MVSAMHYDQHPRARAHLHETRTVEDLLGSLGHWLAQCQWPEQNKSAEAVEIRLGFNTTKEMRKDKDTALRYSQRPLQEFGRFPV